ncbi:MAG: hypothetical protein CMF48_00560 [Legionellales bacterium]|nr:hypothetical protein [Legionellales bacterium]
MFSFRQLILGSITAGCLLSPLAHAWKMEADSVTLTATTSTSSFQSINFDQTYDVVPLVFILGTADSEPAAVRIKNVTTTGFQALAVEPDDENGQHAAMTIHYVAIEPGDHFMPDGTQISATEVAVPTTAHKSGISAQNLGYARFSFDEGYNFTSAPTVIGQIQDMTGEAGTPPSTASRPWMTVVFEDPSTLSVSLALDHSEVNNTYTSSASVPVGVLAIDGNSSGTFDDASGSSISWESLNATLSPATVSVSPYSRTCTKVDLNSSFTSAPLVVGSKVSRNTSDGGWLARCTTGPGNGLTQINLAIEEDADSDAERTPASEDISLLAFSESFTVNFDSGGNAFNQLRYQHPGSANYCDWVPVILRAETQSGTLIRDYSETVRLSTQSSGEWRLVDGDGSFSNSGDGGVAQYTFAESDNGVAKFELLYSGGANELNLKAVQTDDTAVDDDNTTPPLYFAAQNLVVTSEPFETAEVKAFSEPQRAGEEFPVYLSMFGDFEGSGCGVYSGFNDFAPVKVNVEYLEPVANNSKRLKIRQNGEYRDILLSQQTIDVQFTDGQATVLMRYDDVGKIKVQFTMEVTTGDGSEIIVGGSTLPFVIKPYDVQFSKVYVERNLQEVSPHNWSNTETDPQYSFANGTFFQKAGEPFVIHLKPVNKLGAAVQNYGRESVPQGFSVTSELLSPMMGDNGSQGDGTMRSGDIFERKYDFESSDYVFVNDKIAFDEVGYIRLVAHARGLNYLDAGDIVTTPSPAIGRFTPDHFDVELVKPGKLETACVNSTSTDDGAANGFSYVRQPLKFYQEQVDEQVITHQPTVKIKPMAKGGYGIQNYYDFSSIGGMNYYRLPTELVHEDDGQKPIFKLFKSNSGSGSPKPNATVGTPDDIRFYKMATASFGEAGYDGTATYELDADHIFIDLDENNEPIKKFSADLFLAVTVKDPDNIEYKNGEELLIGKTLVKSLKEKQGMEFTAGNEVMHGRLMVANASGQAKDPIIVPIRIEVFDGTQFVVNKEDNCTPISVISQEEIQFYNFEIKDDDLTPLEKSQIRLHRQFVDGETILEIILPEDADIYGTMDVLVPMFGENGSNEYLSSDWPNDGNFDGRLDDNPSATVTIGNTPDDLNTDFWSEIY